MLKSIVLVLPDLCLKVAESNILTDSVKMIGNVPVYLGWSVRMLSSAGTLVAFHWQGQSKVERFQIPFPGQGCVHIL